jgi:hypothetical protein
VTDIEAKQVIEPQDPKLPDNLDLKSILDHVRGQFQYHAGQRLNAIRYFLVTYAVFVAAYVGTLTGRAADVPSYAKLILSVMALAVTLVFWALDVRNQEMVHTDEQGLEEIEQLVSKKYGFKFFNMTTLWESKSSVIRYRRIIPAMFLIIITITASAILRDFLQTFCPNNLKP